MDQRRINEGARNVRTDSVRRLNNQQYANSQRTSKRTISNNVNKRTNYKAKSTLTKSEVRAILKRVNLRLASLALATGIGIGLASPTVISTLANKYNSAKDSKQAIEIANEYDDFIASIEQHSQITSQEDLEALQQLEDAIQRYTDLKYKKDRTFNEEQEFLNACRIICESKHLVIDTYTDSIKNKVAEAYGITDPVLIRLIKVKDEVHFDKGNGKVYHNRTIDTWGHGTIVVNANSDIETEMPKELAENVTNARALLDVDYDPDKMTTADLPVDEIIDTFQEAINFNDYKIVRDADGNLSMELIEQEQTIDDEER